MRSGRHGVVASFSEVAIFREWVIQPKFAEYAFLYVASPTTKEAYPPLWADTGRLDARIPAQQDQLSLDASTVPSGIDSEKQTTTDKETVVPAWVTALSFNAQTLLRKGKRVVLAKQFRELRIAMAGIQETRSRSPSYFSLD